MQRKYCAFSGHRPKNLPWRYDNRDPRCKKLKADLQAQVEGLAARGYTDFFTGMAEGCDLWFADIVEALGQEDPRLKLHCVIAYRWQDEAYSPENRVYYDTLCEYADSLIYLSRQKSRDCFLRRNRWMIDRSSLLLAVCGPERRCGTWSTVHYAQRLGREVILLQPER